MHAQLVGTASMWCKRYKGVMMIGQALNLLELRRQQVEVEHFKISNSLLPMFEIYHLTRTIQRIRAQRQTYSPLVQLRRAIE